jgi:hypothetical protein
MKIIGKTVALSLLLLATKTCAQVRVLDPKRDSLLLKNYALIALRHEESSARTLATAIQYLNSSLVYKQPCFTVFTLPGFNKTYDFTNKGRTSSDIYYLSHDRYRFLTETRILAPEINIEKLRLTKSGVND